MRERIRSFLASSHRTHWRWSLTKILPNTPDSRTYIEYPWYNQITEARKLHIGKNDVSRQMMKCQHSSNPCILHFCRSGAHHTSALHQKSSGCYIVSHTRTVVLFLHIHHPPEFTSLPVISSAGTVSLPIISICQAISPSTWQLHLGLLSGRIGMWYWFCSSTVRMRL